MVAYENKGEEIRQSFSHMSVDKEEMDQIKARLKEAEEQLIQANKELQANKEKVKVNGIINYKFISSRNVQ